MSDGHGEAPMKKKLLGWVQGALGKLEQALDEKKGPDAPAPQAKAPTGGLGQPRPSTGQLPGARGSAPLPKGPQRGPEGSEPLRAPLPGARAANTGSLGRNTDSLVRSAPAPAAASGPLGAPAPPKDPEAAAAESKKRMGFIIKYMKDPESDPVFRDKQLVYKVLTEERSYQQNQIVALSEALAALAEDDPGRAELEEQLATARNRQGQLFTLLKRLTGIRGKTGGTGFIAKAGDEPPPVPGLDQPAGGEPTNA